MAKAPDLGSLLDDVLADRGVTSAPTPPPVAPIKVVAAPAPEASEERRFERLTVNLSPDLIMRVRGAVRALKFGGGYPDLTLASFVSDALGAELGRLERETGQTFAPFRGSLPVGRPIRSS